IAQDGVATALAVGTATITATFEGVSGQASITVDSAAVVSLAVTAASPSIPKGQNESFTARGTFSDGSTRDLTTQVTWASVLSSVATITTSGVATGLAVGTATITATLGGITGQASLTVAPAILQSITVMPANPSVSKGETETFTAIGTLSD